MALEQTQRRRQAVGTIHDIVGAMRAIAAGRIQGAQRALASARRYEIVVERGIAALAAKSAARSLPAVDGRPPLLVVLTSEQPLCGAFNQNVLALADRRRAELSSLGRPYLVAVGQRGLRELARRGIMPDASQPAATSLHGLRDLVKWLARLIDDRYAAKQAGALHVIYNRYQSVSEQVPTEEKILPLDLSHLSWEGEAPTEQGPRGNALSISGRASAGAALSPARRRGSPAYFHYLPVPVLLAGLISEFAFISLYRMAADSFASEQASRLVAMDGATRNAEKMLTSLRDLERRERQGQITRQVLELIAARFTSE
jgi:F-type H+-transporting ATPase subunit gamma